MLIICHHHPPRHITGGVFGLQCGLDYFHKSVEHVTIAKQHVTNAKENGAHATVAATLNAAGLSCTGRWPRVFTQTYSFCLRAFVLVSLGVHAACSHSYCA